MFIKTNSFRFVDIINYLSLGTSYEKWVKAYGCSVQKLWLLYEWFNSPEKLIAGFQITQYGIHIWRVNISSVFQNTKSGRKSSKKLWLLYEWFNSPEKLIAGFQITQYGIHIWRVNISSVFQNTKSGRKSSKKRGCKHSQTCYVTTTISM